PRQPFLGESPEHETTGFLLSQLDMELAEALPQLHAEAIGVFFVLKAADEIIDKTHQVRGTATGRFHPLLEPEIEHVVQINVREHTGNRPALGHSALCLPLEPMVHDSSSEPLINKPQEDRIGDALAEHPS